MTLTPVEVLLVLLVPVLLGVGMLRLLGVVPRTDRLAYGGWAWLAGALGLGIVLSAWLWAGWPLRAAPISLAVVALAVVLFALGTRVPASTPPAELGARAFPAWERALFAAVVALVALAQCDRALVSGATVIVNSDEGVIWAAKAKALFAAGGVGPEFAEYLARPFVVGHPDYPPLNPLLQLWVFAQAGEILHFENRLPIQAFGIALLLIVAGAVRRRARPGVAAVFVACLGAAGFSRYSMLHAFSDLLVACALLACWDAWQRFEEDGERVWLRLAGSTAAVLPWSKNEGRMLVLASLLALGVAIALGRSRLRERRALASALAWALPVGLSVAYLMWFNARFGLVNDLWHDGMVERGLEDGVARLPVIARHVWEIVLDPVNTHFVVLLFLALIAVAPSRALGPRLAFTLALLLAFAGYVAVYMGTYWDLEDHLDHSAARVVYHLVPAAGLWVLLFVVEVLPELSARGAPVRSAARRSSSSALAREQEAVADGQERRVHARVGEDALG